MPLEIERKFLLKNNDWKKSVQQQFVIKQGYLNTHPDRTVRIRIKGSKGILTVKGKTIHATRAEYEYEIPINHAEEMILLCEKPIIEKIRYLVEHHNKIWEIDIFSGANEGLMIAEIELESEDEAFHIPSWIGKEVTIDTRYYNSNLSENPFSKWKSNT